MSNLFQEVLNDANGVESRLLGQSYPYYKNIKSPSEIGMSDKGTIKQMTKDINGLIQYVELLVTGKSKASATGGPLGNKFFLQTGAKCSATDQCTKDANGVSTCQEVDRYIYVNNVPYGNIPFISSGLGQNFTEFRGLIPGAMGNLDVLNPYTIMSAFLSGSTPPCQQITMQVIDASNNKSSETHYVTTVDIRNANACSFPNGRNPLTGYTCKGGVGKNSGSNVAAASVAAASANKKSSKKNKGKKNTTTQNTTTIASNATITPNATTTTSNATITPNTTTTPNATTKNTNNAKNTSKVKKSNKKNSKETFQSELYDETSCMMPEDPIDQIYFASLAAIGIYILYRLMEKAR
jgi:hypothetical protein